MPCKHRPKGAPCKACRRAAPLFDSLSCPRCGTKGEGLGLIGGVQTCNECGYPGADRRPKREGALSAIGRVEAERDAAVAALAARETEIARLRAERSATRYEGAAACKGCNGSGYRGESQGAGMVARRVACSSCKGTGARHEARQKQTVASIQAEATEAEIAAARATAARTGALSTMCLRCFKTIGADQTYVRPAGRGPCCLECLADGDPVVRVERGITAAPAAVAPSRAITLGTGRRVVLSVKVAPWCVEWLRQESTGTRGWDASGTRGGASGYAARILESAAGAATSNHPRGGCSNTPPSKCNRAPDRAV